MASTAGTEALWSDCMLSAIGSEQWAPVLRCFKDASIYQTLAYGRVRWGDSQLRHYVLTCRKEPVAATQVRIMTVAGIGIAYAPWGPMWRRKGVADDPAICDAMCRALRRELVQQQGLWLRVLPPDEDIGSGVLKSRLTADGFEWSSTSYKTIVMDLSYSPQELKRSMRNTWRQALAKAERAAPELIEGTSVELFYQGVELYREMNARKGFAKFVEMEEFARIQADLPEDMLMRILVYPTDGEPVAALAWSEIGATAVPVLAATGNRALRNNALHLLYWRMIRQLQEKGIRWLNLGGIDKEENPGGYTWKTGLSGMLGREVGQIGQFDACQRCITRLAVRWGDWYRTWQRGRRRHTAAGPRTATTS